jgi:hypothetical protein
MSTTAGSTAGSPAGQECRLGDGYVNEFMLNLLEKS